MTNEMFRELEKAINEEFKTLKLDVTMKIEGFDKGFLTDLSRTSLNAEERKRSNSDPKPEQMQNMRIFPKMRGTG